MRVYYTKGQPEVSQFLSSFNLMILKWDLNNLNSTDYTMDFLWIYSISTGAYLLFNYKSKVNPEFIFPMFP